jgi:hypothetical protein
MSFLIQKILCEQIRQIPRFIGKSGQGGDSHETPWLNVMPLQWPRATYLKPFNKHWERNELT